MATGKHPSDEKERTYYMELYELYRAQEEHENLLKHNRLTTFLALQSVVFVTFALSLQKYYEIWDGIHDKNWDADKTYAAIHGLNLKYGLFLLALCAVGGNGSRIAYTSIQSALDAQHAIRKQWFGIKKDVRFDELPLFAAGSDSDQGSTRSSFSTALPQYFLRLWILAFFVLLIALLRS